MGILGQIRELRRRKNKRRQSEEMSSLVIVLMEPGTSLQRVAGVHRAESIGQIVFYFSQGEREKKNLCQTLALLSRTLETEQSWDYPGRGMKGRILLSTDLGLLNA